MTDIVSPEPVTDYHPSKLPPYVSNGLVGLRVGLRPLARGVCILNGFEGLDPAANIETFARAPYPLGGNVAVGRADLAGFPERLHVREVGYDFSCGELRVHMHFDGDDARVELDLLTFCSRNQPSLVLQEAGLRVDRECDLSWTATVDTRGVPGSWVDREVSRAGTGAVGPVDGLLRWSSYGDLSTCGVAYATELAGAPDAERTFDHSRIAPLSTTYRWRAVPGHRYRLRRMVSLLPKALHNEPHVQAARLLQAGRLRGFDRLRADNADRWRELWKGRLVLAGAPGRWQALADAAYFYLHTATHPSSPASTALFGLAYWPDYHYYRGHVMWDVETFALPTLTLTNPRVAYNLLSFRHSRIEGARTNAAATGGVGLRYPWESSLRYGQEAAPVDALAAAAEQHVSMDVAVAFARYLHATGDSEFGRARAWPVISGVADWICGRVERTARGYEIHSVNGIAETPTTVDNNAFVNMAAIVALREAAALGRDLGWGEPDRWERIASRIVLPIDPERGIILNHDGYHPDEEQGATPEAPAGLFPLGFQVDPETERRTLEYYLRLADRYAGQPMLSSMLGVYAARVGDRDAALELFERGYADFVVQPFSITTEFSPKVYPDQPLAGPFTANLGGFLTACLYGLTGVRLTAGPPQSWCERPVTLPSGWDAVHLDRVFTKDGPASLTAEQGADRARFAFELSPGATFEPEEAAVPLVAPTVA